MTAASPNALLALGALAAAVVAVFVARALPRVSFVAWAFVLFLVPVWIGVGLGIAWSAITLITLLLVAVNWSRMSLHPADAWVGLFALAILALLGLKGITLEAAVPAILEWALPYTWGRVVLTRVDKRWVAHTIAGVAVVAALLALVEFATSFNPFVLLPGLEPLASSWHNLQERGGVLRAEGAFGHSIALGASLAMASSFVVAARWHLVPKVLALMAVIAATVVTFSRAGLMTLALTLVLSLCLQPGVSRRFRAVAVTFGAVGVATVIPLVDTVFGAAGEEAAGSAGYRTDLLVLLTQVKLFGDPGDWTTRIADGQYLGYFARSVDNTLVLTLLRYGVVPTVLMLAAIICAVLMVFRRQGRGPASLAVLGQLPSLLVVALITQYGVFLWFCVGLAVSWGLTRDERPPPEGESDFAALRGRRARHVAARD